jgi:hypothetical protein
MPHRLHPKSSGLPRPRPDLDLQALSGVPVVAPDALTLLALFAPLAAGTVASVVALL